MSPGTKKKKKKATSNHYGGSTSHRKPAQLPESSIADETEANVEIGENRVQSGKGNVNVTQVHESSSIDVTLGSKDTLSADNVDLVGNHIVHSDEEQADSKHARKMFEEMTHPDLAKKIKGDWASLFKNNRNNSQGIKLEKLEGDNGSEVMIDDEDMQDVSKSFGSTLIGYVAGKSTGKLAIVQFCYKWKGKEKVIFHRSGWVVIRFNSEEDRDRVLEEGPYNVFGSPFLLKPIPDLFDFSDCEIRQVPVWVQFPNLPLDLWTSKALSKIGSKIGTPLNTDKLTRIMDRVCFARVLIEVDVSKELQHVFLCDARKELFLHRRFIMNIFHIIAIIIKYWVIRRMDALEIITNRRFTKEMLKESQRMWWSREILQKSGLIRLVTMEAIWLKRRK